MKKAVWQLRLKNLFLGKTDAEEKLSPIIHIFHIADVDKNCGGKNQNRQFAQMKNGVEKK